MLLGHDAKAVYFGVAHSDPLHLTFRSPQRKDAIASDSYSPSCRAETSPQSTSYDGIHPIS